MSLSVWSGAAVALILGAALCWQTVRYRQCQRALAAATRRLTLLLRTAEVGMLELGVGGRVLWASPRIPEMLGLDGDAKLTLERILDSVRVQEDRVSLEEALDLSRQSREPVRTETRVNGTEREPRWLSITLVGNISRDTEVPVTLVVRDATDRRRTESDLHRQRQQLTHLGRVSLLGELSGALAHELNQPLTSILSNAEAGQHFLAEKSPDLGEVRDILDDIVSDDRRAGDVIRRLRALLTRGETQFQRLEIRNLLQDVLTLENAELNARNVRLTLHVPDKLPPVRADRIELQQVLLNLFVNAVEAMSTSPSPDRRIEIAAATVADGAQVRVSVADHGRGISPELLDRVFDPFFTTKREGLGVGLAISRTIIAAHSGRLWATSTPGGGASFHFTLPVFQEERHDQPVS